MTTQSISTSVARLLHLDAETRVKRELDAAVEAAYACFTHSHAAGFSECMTLDFLQHRGQGIVIDYVDGHLDRTHAAMALADAWDHELIPVNSAQRKYRMANEVLAADGFLQELNRELVEDGAA